MCFGGVVCRNIYASSILMKCRWSAKAPHVFFVFIVLWLRVVKAYTQAKFANGLNPDIPTSTHRESEIMDSNQLVAEVRKRLIEQYGGQSGEVAEFDNLLQSLRTATPSTDLAGMNYNVTIPPDSRYANALSVRDTERFATRLIQLGVEKFNRKQKLFLKSDWPQRFIELRVGESDLKGKRDVPCETPQDCARLNQIINACETAREQCYTIYAAYNQATNVFNQVISVLCACIFIGPAHICALKNFPYTCTSNPVDYFSVYHKYCYRVGVFPYQVFSTFATGSSSVWEVVKTLSSLCRFHADPCLVPKIE